MILDPRILNNARELPSLFGSSFHLGNEPMATINIDRLSLRELQDLDGRIQKAIVVARDRERAEIKQKIEALISVLWLDDGRFVRRPWRCACQERLSGQVR